MNELVFVDTGEVVQQLAEFLGFLLGVGEHLLALTDVMREVPTLRRDALIFVLHLTFHDDEFSGGVLAGVHKDVMSTVGLVGVDGLHDALEDDEDL